ncbi:hypothetical protein [Magnetovibrio blakemorei]|nr:hypothetical protein [Magnetovibrio blakemorei]
MDQGLRDKLSGAIKLNGGIRSVAKRTGLNASNLSSWLKGRPTVSQEKIDGVLKEIGLPDLKPAEDYVHVWRIYQMSPETDDALFLYFPDGFKATHIRVVEPELREFVPPWGGNELFRERVAEFAFITDGNVRASLVVEKGWDSFMPPFQLATDPRVSERFKDVFIDDAASFNITNPSINEFDRILYKLEAPAKSGSLEEVLHTIFQEGIFYDEAVRRLKKK